MSGESWLATAEHAEKGRPSRSPVRPSPGGGPKPYDRSLERLRLQAVAAALGVVAAPTLAHLLSDGSPAEAGRARASRDGGT